MLVTPYLTSMATLEVPQPHVEVGTTSWFQVHAEPVWPPAVDSAAPTTAGKESAMGR